MKRVVYSLLIGIVLPLYAELPGESEALIEKLNEWELEEQVKLQEEISKKRSEVILVLRKQFEDANQSGDLDGGVAIMSEIERLTALVEEGMASHGEQQKRWSEEEVEGTLWRSPNGMFWELGEEGIVKRGGQSTIDRWEISRRGILTLYFGGFNGSGKIDLQIDDEIKTGTGEINGEEKIFVRLNKTVPKPD